jgi:hypothetical protein
MGRFPAYVLAALLAMVAGAPAAWAQSQAFPTTTGYPYGTQQYSGYNSYGSAGTFSSYPYYGSAYTSQAGNTYGGYPYGQWGSSNTGYGSGSPYGYGYGQYGGSYNGYYGYGQPGASNYGYNGYYGYGQPGGAAYGYPYGQAAPYGQPPPYASSPYAYPPQYGAPYGGAPNSYGYNPTSNPSYPAPYGALPPAGGYPTDPYSYGQMASYPYNSPSTGYPQVSQTTQTSQTGCNGNCTLGTYFYGVGVPASTPYTGGNNQITPYNQGGLATALTGVNMPVQNTQPMQFPAGIPVSQY